MICRNDYSINRPICVYNIFYTYTSIEKANVCKSDCIVFRLSVSDSEMLIEKKGWKKTYEQRKLDEKYAANTLILKDGHVCIILSFLFLFFTKYKRKDSTNI